VKKLAIGAAAGFAVILILKHPVVWSHAVTGVWHSVRAFVGAL
jgi:hypothetical protein